jgi:hypothetical protein
MTSRLHLGEHTHQRQGIVDLWQQIVEEAAQPCMHPAAPSARVTSGAFAVDVGLFSRVSLQTRRSG